MFKKLEEKLRRIIAEEVRAVDVTLNNERDKIISAISIHAKSTTNGIEREFAVLLAEFEGKLRADAASIIAEKNQLISELTAKIADMQQTLTKFTTWKADESTVAADHELRKVR